MHVLSKAHVPGAFDKHLATLVQALVISGLCLTFSVLCAFAYMMLHSAAKHHLNRVSFRLLTYSLVANLVFGCCFVSGAQATGPSPQCSLTVFLVNLTVMFSGGMCFCIALNLELVLVHGFNGNQMEKYYILGTSAVCVLCNIPPYAAGQFGWNVLNQACWFSNPDQRAMLRWLLGTQTFWILLMGAGEAVAFLMIVRYFILYERNMRRTHEESRSSGTSSSCISEVRLPRSPMVQYRNVILRIGLYPLVACILNLSTVLDLYLVADQVSHPIMTELNWRLSIADLSIYSLRPVIYAVLALTDPAFIRAVREARRPASHQLQMSGLRGRFSSAGPGDSLHIGFPPSETASHSGLDAEAGHSPTHADAEAEAPPQSARAASESKLPTGKVGEHLAAGAAGSPEVNAWARGPPELTRRGSAPQMRGRRGPAPVDLASQI
ncbi:hypothetical protein B0H15DRAFT_950885 [Mycena belliarum]|uniref:G-protein coupled receptors family 2 profile 2 domain-containing protein n=1 Tax=Mycena belliarum TaxID=1033014 RepID=A0AAD6XMX8_9AGAR|nr:hypothetical protein B0H15DRAFT_950885 [Mycena belliae]